MEVRAEHARDRDAVLAVHRRAFGDHGNQVAQLVEALRRDDPAGLSLVADHGGEIAGHILLTRSLLDAARQLVPVQVLSPLAVLPDQQRRGIGAALIRRGLDLLDERGVPLVFVEGDPRYYARAGFRAGGDRGFRKPSLRIPDDAFQVIALSAHQPWMTGTLVYAAAFWDHDSVGLRHTVSPASPSPRATAVPTVQVDNERVRVTEWRFAPGAETGWHRHELDYTVVPMTTGQLMLDSGSSQTIAELVVGRSYFRSAPVEHNVINASGHEFVFVEIELKR